ncbi:MAG: hypothetical protein ACYC6B_06230 [Thermoleophilia bacterium]
METALDVLQWNQQGIGIKEIRQRIDAKYSAMGYTPTPTPPIP